MKTLNELIETAPYTGTEWTNDALYYLKAYKDFVDRVIKIIVENEGLIREILADYANETITETEELLKEYNKDNEKMKTIDEVIHALKICDSDIDDCKNCAYFEQNCENLRPLRADALYYLEKINENIR